jgi:hypothetical protein
VPERVWVTARSSLAASFLLNKFKKMTGFKKIKFEVKEYVARKKNPYLSPSDVDRGKWLAGASHCTVRRLMLSGEIPSVKVGTAIRAHYLDVIEYLRKNYLIFKPLIKDKVNKKNDGVVGSYYQTNKEKIRKQQKKYYQRKKDKLIQQAKQYYADNKNSVLEKNKNSERKKGYDNEYYLKNKSEIQQRKRLWRLNNSIEKDDEKK